MNDNKKASRYLLIVALLLLVLSGVIGNLYFDALTVLFGLAVAAATITDMLGNVLRKRRSE